MQFLIFFFHFWGWMVLILFWNCVVMMIKNSQKHQYAIIYIKIYKHKSSLYIDKTLLFNSLYNGALKFKILRKLQTSGCSEVVFNFLPILKFMFLWNCYYIKKSVMFGIAKKKNCNKTCQNKRVKSFFIFLLFLS